MKKLISILLVMTLLFSVLTTTAISAYAEEGTGEEVADETTPDQDTTTEGDETTEGGDVTEDGEITDGEDTTGGDETIKDDQSSDSEEDTSSEETNPIADFLASFLPLEALEGLKDALFGFVEQMWNFIMSNETYSNIATAVLAVLALLMIPVVIGAVVIVYCIIGGMIIIAGALTAIIELLLGIVPTIRL